MQTGGTALKLQPIQYNYYHDYIIIVLQVNLLRIFMFCAYGSTTHILQIMVKTHKKSYIDRLLIIICVYVMLNVNTFVIHELKPLYFLFLLNTMQIMYNNRSITHDSIGLAFFLYK